MVNTHLYFQFRGLSLEPHMPGKSSATGLFPSPLLTILKRVSLSCLGSLRIHSPPASASLVVKIADLPPQDPTENFFLLLLLLLQVLLLLNTSGCCCMRGVWVARVEVLGQFIGPRG